MTTTETINSLADCWAELALGGLLGSGAVLALVALTWWALRHRASASLGGALFLLVLAKPLVPFEIEVPILAGSAPPRLSQGPLTVASPAAEPTPTVPLPPADLAPSSWLFIGWVAIAGGLLLLLVRSQFRLSRWCRRATPRPDHDEDIARLAAEAGVRPPRLLAHPEATTPFVYGLFSPRLVVPEDFFSTLDPDGRRWVLFHELAHLRRRDLWTLTFQRLVKSVLFFNPAVWLASRQVDRLREFACDDFALAHSRADRRCCGRSFLALVERSSSGLPGTAALALTEPPSGYRTRLRRILDTDRAPAPSASATGLALLVAFALVCLPTLVAQAPDDSRPSPVSPAPPAISPSVRIAIDENGALAITGPNSDDSIPIAHESLESHLRQIVEESPAIRAIVAPVRATSLEHVVRVTRECVSCGIDRFSVVVAGNDAGSHPAAEHGGLLVTSPIGGTIVEILVVPGQAVAAGQALARFDALSALGKLERTRSSWEAMRKESRKQAERAKEAAARSTVDTSAEAAHDARLQHALASELAANLGNLPMRIKAAEIYRDQHTIHASSDGTITTVHITPYQNVSRNAPIVTIAPGDPQTTSPLRR